MRFISLHFKDGRRTAKGLFQVVDVNGASMFVGDQDEPGDGSPTSLSPTGKRIAVPVASVEYAIPEPVDEAGVNRVRCTRRTQMEAEVMEPRTYSIVEAATLLGISERHAYEMARTGRIPSIRLGRRYLIPRRALLDMLGDQDEPGDGTPTSLSPARERIAVPVASVEYAIPEPAEEFAATLDVRCGECGKYAEYHEDEAHLYRERVFGTFPRDGAVAR